MTVLFGAEGSLLKSTAVGEDSPQSAAVECMEQPGEYSPQSTAVGEDSPQSTAVECMEQPGEYSPQSTAVGEDSTQSAAVECMEQPGEGQYTVCCCRVYGTTR